MKKKVKQLIKKNGGKLINKKTVMKIFLLFSGGLKRHPTLLFSASFFLASARTAARENARDDANTRGVVLS